MFSCPSRLLIQINRLPASVSQVDSPQDVETESSATEKVVALTVHLLGETQQHANSLATGMSKSVENGQLQKDMYSLGFKHNLAGIEMISIHIEGSGVAPQYYPAMHFVEDDAPYASFSQDYKEIEVVVVSNAVFDAEVGIDVPLKGTKNKKLFGIGTPVVVGAAVGASLVVLAVVFLVFRLCKKAVRSPDQNVGSPCGSTASRPSLQIATHVSVEGKGHEDSAKDGMDSPPVSTADVSQATNRVQLTAMQRAFSCIDEDVASSFTAKGSSHRRLPSEILQGQGLLSMQDLYTPATTPGHSRQGSTMVDPGFDFTAAAAVDLADVAISSMSGMDTQQQPTGKDIPSSASTANLLSASEGREL